MSSLAISFAPVVVPSRRAGSTRPARELGACSDGAIVVFGIFFAVFALGMLYYMVGLAATIHFRERLQDAADASAFAAAIVHARGMNTIALINLIMAAILAVLVALRLIETLIIAAQLILAGLSLLSFGGTAAVASALEPIRQAVHNIAEAAEPVIHNILKVLHVAGDVVRVVTPLGANGAVLVNVARNYQPEVWLGVAIPPRFTLPVEDDEFNYLCGKSGRMAAKLAMLPLSPILPGFIENKVEDLAEKLISAGSSWFCGEGDPPSIEIDMPTAKHPQSQDMADCLNPDKQNKDSIETCRKAEETEFKAMPDPETGNCREGQTLCVPASNDGEEVPFGPGSFCEEATANGTTVSAADCETETAADGRAVPKTSTAYGQGLLSARQNCRPDGSKRNYRWQERTVDVVWTRSATNQPWSLAPTQTFANPSGTSLVTTSETDARRPCDEREFVGRGGMQWVDKGDGWNASNVSAPACSVDRRPEITTPGLQTTTRRRQVVQVLSCQEADTGQKMTVPVEAVNVGKDKKHDNVDIGDSDVGGDFGDMQMSDDELGSSGGGEASMDPFKFEEGHLLGTSDMQIRSLVIGHRLGDSELNGNAPPPSENETVHTFAKRVVRISKWEYQDEGLATLDTASETWGLFAVAQAEYYFDVGQPEDSSGFAEWDRNDKTKTRDYLWYMGWTARVRRFRLSFKVDGESADGESSNGSNSEENDRLFGAFGGAMQGGSVSFTDDQKSEDDLEGEGPSPICFGNATCEHISGVMSSWDSLFLH